MDTKSLIVGVAITLLVVGSIGGVIFGVTQMDTSPFDQTEEPEYVNESDISPEAKEHQQSAGVLSQELDSSYDYEFRVFIEDGNVTTVTYTSEAENPDMLKYEMKQIAVLYAEVAADNPAVGSLVLQANGVTLTVPNEVAVTRGNGGMNDEEYFKHVRWDSADSDRNT